MINYTDEYRGYGTATPTTAGDYTISGIAIPYNSTAYISNGIYEVIKPGAVSAFLNTRPNIRCIIEHKGEYVLGSTVDQTLRLWDTAEGLRYSIALPNTTYASDLVAVMQQNPKTFGTSFHMQLQPKDSSLSRHGTSGYLRTITSISQILEITITAFPYYTSTTAILQEAAKMTGDGGEAAKGLLEYLKIRERA